MMHGGGHWQAPDSEDDKRPLSRKIVRRVGAAFRPYTRWVVAMVVLIVITSGVGVVNPLLIAVVFDQALFPHRHGVTLPPNVKLLWVLVAIMCALPIITGAISVVQTYVTSVLGQRMMQDFRDRLYVHLQGMSLHFFTSTKTGNVQSRIANDVGGIESVVTSTASSIISNVVIIASTLAAMVFLSWQLTVLSLVVMPFFVWFTQKVGKERRVVTRSTQESMAEMTAITQETLSVSGVLLAKVFGQQRFEIERFRKENVRLSNLQIRQQMVGRYFFAFVQVFFSITPALVYLVAGLVIAANPLHPAIEAGTIVAFTTLQSRLYFPLGQMLQITVQVQGSMALFERIFEYLDMPHEITDIHGAVALSRESVQGRVAFEDVFFAYPGGPHGVMTSRQWALHNVSLEIEPGTLVALVGPSGAGKTTLTYLIPRLYEVTKGHLRIDGHDIRDVTMESLAEVMGIVTQETYLFHASIRDNIRYGSPHATDAQMEDAARAAFIHERVMEMPEGYDTVVGERGYRLSGGEKQRLAIARVILRDPRILILDEATSNLDTASERYVQDALAAVMKGRTSIVIAHRLSTILAADSIVVVADGEVREQGTHHSLVAANGLYATLYEQQFRDPPLENAESRRPAV